MCLLSGMAKPETRLRTVVLCRGVPPKGRSRVWAFGYADLSKLLGKSQAALRMAVHQGRLDPTDLEAICLEWLRRRVGLCGTCTIDDHGVWWCDLAKGHDGPCARKEKIG